MIEGTEGLNQKSVKLSCYYFGVSPFSLSNINSPSPECFVKEMSNTDSQ